MNVTKLASAKVKALEIKEKICICIFLCLSHIKYLSCKFVFYYTPLNLFVNKFL